MRSWIPKPTIRLLTVLAFCALPAAIGRADALQDWRMGVEASNQQAHAQAAYYFSRAIDLGWLSPGDRAKVYYNRGRSYGALGDYDWAIEDYSHAIELDPKFAEAFHGRAVVLDQTGERLRAIKDLQRAHALAPTNSDIRQTLAALGLIPGDKFLPFEKRDNRQSTGNERSTKIYELHIASLRSPEGAVADWQRLRNKYVDVIGNLALVVRQVDLKDKGRFHRVLASGSLNGNSARSLCRRLKQSGQYCAVMVARSE